MKRVLRQVILARLFIPLLFPYEPKVEANQKEHEVDDAPQSQQFWGNGKPKKRNSQVSKIEIRVYPSANKKRTGEKFTDLFPINAHNSKRRSSLFARLLFALANRALLDHV